MLKRNIIMSAIVGLLLVCGVLPSWAGSETEKNKALALRVFNEILNQGKYEVFAEIYAKNFIKHVDRRDETLGEEIEDAKAMRNVSSDLVMTIDHMVAEGDKVAILYAGRGTSTGPFSGMPATGKKYSVTGMTLYRFSNGKIVEEWTVYNMLDILNQLGYAAGPPTK